MTVFFTADTHFGDHRTINIHRRPFGSVAEMDAQRVSNWNALVGPEDEVWHLHGHSHKRLKPMPRQFDVGVDPNGFAPVTLAALDTVR